MCLHNNDGTHASDVFRYPVYVYCMYKHSYESYNLNRTMQAESNSCPGRKGGCARYLPTAWIHSTRETSPRHRINHLDPWRRHLQAWS